MWIWVSGIAVIVVAVVSIAYEQHYTGEKQEATRQKDCVSLSISPEEKHACDKDAQSRKDYSPWWYVLVAWPAGITTWALIATCFIVAWQSYETRESAHATAEAATAAKASVKFAEAQWSMAKEKERARMDFQGGSMSVEQNDAYWHLKGTVKARNIGQSRAFIVSNYSKFTVKAPDHPYPAYEEYEQLPFADSFVDPDQSNDFVILNFTFSPPSEDKIRFLSEDLHAARRTVHLYGFIDYETLGMRYRKEFGFIWKVIDPSWYLGGALLTGEDVPPDEVQKITFGYWTIDPERSKPEYEVSRERQS
jgi:hypothetical protein